MPRWLKVLLVLVAIGVVVAGVGMAAFARWMKAHGAELRAQGRQAEAEGQTFAENKDSTACIRESMARLDKAKDKGIFEQAAVGHFLQGCLNRARREPSLCVGVPEKGDIVQSALWRAQRCSDLGKPESQMCAQLLGKLQDACHPR